MDTQVTTNWRELLDRAECGHARGVVASLAGERGPVASLLKGYSIYTSQPEAAKDLFAQAKSTSDPDLSYEAAIFEARCYEYLGQFDEGKILIRRVLRRQLSPVVRAHAMFVFSVLQVATPKRALRTLNSINLDVVSTARKARVFYWRAKLEGDLERFDQALVNYAGAAVYFEEVGNLLGVAHAHNNRASILRKLKHFEMAHESADLALSLLPQSDPFTANFLDQKAQLFIAEERFADAELLARHAVEMVDGTDRLGVLCESLCTLARAYAGQGNHSDASATFRRAEAIVSTVDSLDMRFAFTKARRDAAKDFLRAMEIELTQLALRMSDGMVRAAAKKLDLTHSSIIKSRKRNLAMWKPQKPLGPISKILK